MKALFVHDNRFYDYHGEIYSFGHFSYDLLWTRYLAYFDEIVVGGRIVPTTEANTVRAFSKSGGPAVSFIDLPDLMTPAGVLRLGRAWRRLREASAQVDCVIARVPSSLGSLACLAARSLGKPYAVEVVGCAWDAFTNYGTAMGTLSALPFTLLEKYTVARAPYAIYVSRHFLQQRYPNRHVSVGCPDAVIPATPEEVLEARLRRIEAGFAGRPVRFGLIASLYVGYKGHGTAIRALASIKHLIPDFRLCFLGDGDPARWQRLADDCGIGPQLEICGTLPGGAPIMQWLDNIDVFLMPSLQETLGRALLEAMSRGCPALGSRETAIPEQLGDDCLHRGRDHRELAALIRFLLDHPRYMQLCAIENFHRARKYSEEIIASRREAFWRQVLAGVAAGRRTPAAN